MIPPRRFYRCASSRCRKYGWRRETQAILVFTAFFPQFVDPQSYALSFTILDLTFLVFETFAIVVYSFIGAKLGRHIRDGRTLKWFNRTSGAMMIGFGLALMFTRRPA